MYPVDRHDRVVELTEVPRPSVGAPLPVALADEGRLLLAYLPEVPVPGWDGTWTRVVDLDTADPVVLVRCTGVAAWQWGPPNDEAFQGHPLADRGLRPYGVFRVEGSSWIRQLERMNRVHPQHRPEAFKDLAHLVFTFHDSTLEALARGFTAEPRSGPMAAVVGEMQQLLLSH
jgi:hypothetical protein